MALVVWTVFCVGFALIVGIALREAEEMPASSAVGVIVGVGSVLWAFGIAVWFAVGWAFG